MTAEQMKDESLLLPNHQLESLLVVDDPVRTVNPLSQDIHGNGMSRLPTAGTMAGACIELRPHDRHLLLVSASTAAHMATQ
jgi:hypothetical protein